MCGVEKGWGGRVHGWFLSLKRGKVIQDVSPCPLLFSEVECQHTEGRRAHLSTNKPGFVWDVVATSVRTKTRLHSTSTGPELLLRGPGGGGAGPPAWRSKKMGKSSKRIQKIASFTQTQRSVSGRKRPPPAGTPSDQVLARLSPGRFAFLQVKCSWTLQTSRFQSSGVCLVTLCFTPPPT